jgi:hypothetical protein
MTHHTLCVHIGSSIQKQTHTVSVSFYSGMHQRRVSSLCVSIHMFEPALRFSKEYIKLPDIDSNMMNFALECRNMIAPGENGMFNVAHKVDGILVGPGLNKQTHAVSTA